MKIPTRGGLTALAVCAAAAVAAVSPSAAAASGQESAGGPGDDRRSAAPDVAQDATAEAATGAADGSAGPSGAVADHARQARDARIPLIVPFETMEGALPVDAPRLVGTLPAVPLAPPGAPGTSGDRLVPDPLLPALETNGDGPSAGLEAPVPTLNPANRGTAARLATPPVPLSARGPEARLGLPVERPGADPTGVPELGLPDAALTAPAAQGQPGAGFGVGETGRPSRLPLNDVAHGTLGALGGGAGGLV